MFNPQMLLVLTELRTQVSLSMILARPPSVSWLFIFRVRIPANFRIVFAASFSVDGVLKDKQQLDWAVIFLPKGKTALEMLYCPNMTDLVKVGGKIMIVGRNKGRY